MNREELNMVSQGWLQQAGADLSERISNFMRENHFSLQEVASAIGINVGVLDAVMHGSVANITAEALIKLFTMNNLALDVKPFGETPMAHGAAEAAASHRFGRPTPHHPHTRSIPVSGPDSAPRARRFDTDPIRRWYNPNPQRNVNAEQRPVGDNPHAAPTPRYDNVEAPNAEARHHDDNPYSEMSIQNLRALITANLWDTELDINHASKDELVDFLLNKEARMHANNGEQHPMGGGSHQSHTETEREETPQPEMRNEHHVDTTVRSADDFVDNFLERAGRFLKSRPDLAESIKGLVDRL